jgi:lipid-A-disaccharide synthase
VSGESRILLSAGEPSGDLHGAGVVAALRAARPDLHVEGNGGPQMAAAGMTIKCDSATLGALGFFEVIRTVPRHLRLLRSIAAEAKARRYVVAILVDYPGFHLRLGEALRAAGVPVLQYVAPQLWAWRPGRLPKLQRAADRVAAILPFEAPWFTSRGVPCEFVGHPVLDREWPTQASARAALRLPPEVPVLGIFPGSREGEIDRNWPLFRDVGRRMLAEGRCHRVVVAGTAGGYYPDAPPFLVHRGNPEQVLAASTAALVKSGTTTLEAACTGTPMVVAYRTARTTYEIARRLIMSRWISLVNLVLDEALVPEFWHLPVSAAPVADALRPLLDVESQAHQAQRSGLARAHTLLGTPGASRRVAELAIELCRC